MITKSELTFISGDTGKTMLMITVTDLLKFAKWTDWISALFVVFWIVRIEAEINQAVVHVCTTTKIVIKCQLSYQFQFAFIHHRNLGLLIISAENKMTIFPGQTAAVVDFRSLLKDEGEVAFIFSWAVCDDWHILAFVSTENQNIGGFRRASVFWAWASIWATRLTRASVQVFFLAVKFNNSYFCLFEKLQCYRWNGRNLSLVLSDTVTQAYSVTRRTDQQTSIVHICEVCLSWVTSVFYLSLVQ